MKCSNCDTQAAYVYKPTESSIIPFCVPHVPGFLVPRMKAGLLDKADGFDDFLAEAIATIAPETAEEPVVAEPEKKAPSKKAAKKDSDVQTDVE